MPSHPALGVAKARRDRDQQLPLLSFQAASHLLKWGVQTGRESSRVPTCAGAPSQWGPSPRNTACQSANIVPGFCQGTSAEENGDHTQPWKFNQADLSGAWGAEALWGAWLRDGGGKRPSQRRKAGPHVAFPELTWCQLGLCLWLI